MRREAPPSAGIPAATETVTAGGDIVEAARAVAPTFRERATEGELLRTMPEDLVAATADAGLFTLLLPAELGGTPTDPLAVVDALEVLAHADGSAGWTTMIGNGSSFLAWYAPEVARHVLATSRYPAITSVFAPRGVAIPVGPDRYRISGRWAFNSGSPHCDWFLVSVVMDDGGALGGGNGHQDPGAQDPRGQIGDGGQDREGGRTGEPAQPRPDWRNVQFALVPAADARMIETWDAAGLQGTGSHDVAVDGAVVPADRLANPFHQPPLYDDPHCRFPFWTLVMVLVSGFPLGVARRALDEFRELAPRKARSHLGPLALDPLVQVDLARAEAALDAARTLVHAAISDAWDTVRRGGPLTVDQRARVSAAACHAMATAVQVVDTVFPHAGASSVYLSHPLQRCLRDIHVAAQHVVFSTLAWRRIGQALLRVPQPDVQI